MSKRSPEKKAMSDLSSLVKKVDEVFKRKDFITPRVAKEIKEFLGDEEGYYCVNCGATFLELDGYRCEQPLFSFLDYTCVDGWCKACYPNGRPGVGCQMCKDLIQSAIQSMAINLEGFKSWERRMQME